MPVVQIEMIKGRTLQQKRDMVQKVTDVLVDTIQCKKEAVTIVIREVDKENIAQAGVLHSDM